MERIDKEVERELARSGAVDKPPLAALVTAWPSIVGNDVARNAWPARVGRDGTLHVNTTSATWAFELDRLSPEIRSQLRAALGPDAPPKLRFAVGPVPEPEAASTHGRLVDAPPILSPELHAETAATVAAIEDDELRDLVLRAARASLGRRPSDRRF